MRLTADEREFLNDIECAIEDWDFEIEDKYHDDCGFNVDIVFTDEDEYALCADEIWNALVEVSRDWDAGIDELGSASIGLCLHNN